MRRQLLAEQLMNFLFCGNQVNRETSQTMAVRPASLYKKNISAKYFLMWFNGSNWGALVMDQT